MTFFNATKLTVAGLLIFLFLLSTGRLTGSLEAGEAKQSQAPSTPKRHMLAATLETTHPNETPKLTVNSGDIVAVETMMHAHDKIQPGVAMEEIVALRKANSGGGPHSLTGPIYVNGAEPGDVMEIRIQKITPKPVGFNFNLPGKEFPTIGALADAFPESS
jgi:acetamidase/formamidase